MFTSSFLTQSLLKNTHTPISIKKSCWVASLLLSTFDTFVKKFQTKKEVKNFLS